MGMEEAVRGPAAVSFSCSKLGRKVMLRPSTRALKVDVASKATKCWDQMRLVTWKQGWN